MAERAPNWVPLVLALVCLGPRLPGLTLPLLEEGHAWRQSVTAMVARNFHRHGHRLFWPELDLLVEGGKPGYTNSEFPLYPWLVSLGYGLIGVREWVGRLFSAFCAVATTLLLFALVRRWHGDWAATLAAAFWALSPLGIYYTRAFLPEPLMVLLLVAAVQQLAVWVETAERRPLLLALLCATLAPMVKQPALHLWPVLLTACWLRFGRKAWRRPETWLLAVLPLAGMVAWYRWAGWLGDHYLRHFAVGGSSELINFGLWRTGAVNFYPRFATTLIVLIGGVTGWLAALCGLGRGGSRSAPLSLIWLACALLAATVANGATISHHYYNLVLLPPLAALVGRGAARWTWGPLRWTMSLLVLCGPLLVISLPVVPSWYEIRGGEVRAAAEVRARTAESATVYTLCYGTQLLYACDRRGEFLLPDDPFLSPANVQQAATRGLGIFATGQRGRLESAAGAELNAWLNTRRTIAAGPEHLVVDLQRRQP